MARKSASSSFFSIVVPVAALIVTTTLIFQQTNLASKARGPKMQSFTFELQEGYNSIVSPLKSDMTMQDVCDELGLDEVMRWDNSDEVIGPRTYDCNDELLPQTKANMMLSPETPLLFELDEAQALTVSGTKARMDYDVSEPGVYVFGFKTNRTLYASDVCKMLDTRNRDYGVREVYRIDSRGWETIHECDSPDDSNFEIFEGYGYGVWVTESDDTSSPRYELQRSL